MYDQLCNCQESLVGIFIAFEGGSEQRYLTVIRYNNNNFI